MKLSAALCFAILFACCHPVVASVVIENLARPGAVEIRVTDEPMSLASMAIIEKQTPSGWVTVVRDIVLTASCDNEKPNECLPLPVGAALRPVPWTGFSCSGQCNQSCKKNVYAGAGMFRLTIFSCDHASQFHSAPFSMPPTPKA